MKRLMLLAMAFLVIVSTVGPYAVAAENQTVLLIIRSGESPDLELMLTKEVGVMKDTLQQAGFEVAVATATGQPLVAEKTTLNPDVKLIDVKVEDYVGLIMPCMAIGSPEEPVPPDPSALAIVKEAVAEGKPVAAQFGAVVVLAEAGVLTDKKYAYFSEESVEQAPVLKNGVFSGNGVLKDGKIITSGICPFIAKERGLQDGTAELTKALIAVLGDEK